MRKETDASEAENHQRPSGGLGDKGNRRDDLIAGHGDERIGSAGHKNHNPGSAGEAKRFGGRRLKA